MTASCPHEWHHGYILSVACPRCGATAAEEVEAWKREVNPAASTQPAPTGEGTPITPLVVADLQARSAAGEKKYGTVLRAHNGRDALMDAYQEALDLCQYLRQAMYERDGR